MYTTTTMKMMTTILQYKDLTIEIQHMWNIKASDTSNKRGNWNHLKIIQTIPEQQTGKEWHITKNSHIGHCTCTLESTNVKVQTYLTYEIVLHIVQIINTEQLQHYIPSKHGLFQEYNLKHPASTNLQ